MGARHVRKEQVSNRIRPEEMRIFIALGDARNLTAAAASLDLPLHTVSRALKRIEKVAETTLVRRNGDGLHLTSVGSEYLLACQDVLHAHEQATQVLVANQREPEGKLQVGAPDNFSRFVLTEVLDEFRSAFPKVTIEISPYNAGWDQGPQVEHDVLLKTRSPNESRNHFKLFPAVRQGVFASPKFVATHGEPTHPQELSKFDCVGYGQRHTWNFVRHREHLTLSPPLTAIIPDPEMLSRLAIKSVGIAVLPLWLAHAPMQEGKLVTLLNDWPIPPLDFCAVYRGGLRGASKEGAFVNFLASVLGTSKDPRCQGEDPKRFFLARR